MATIWFVSDTHFHHANIIQYCSRPFRDVTEMNEFLVARWNDVVKPQDHIYHLGDVTMERDNQGRGLGILQRLNGHKRLIMGNHDHYHVKHYMIHFEKIMAMNRIDQIWFTHVPVHPASLGTCRANVHGHIHSNQAGAYPAVRKVDKNGKVRWVPYVNISVEVTNYRPLSLEEVKERIEKAAKEPNYVAPPG